MVERGTILTKHTVWFRKKKNHKREKKPAVVSSCSSLEAHTRSLRAQSSAAAGGAVNLHTPDFSGEIWSHGWLNVANIKNSGNYVYRSTQARFPQTPNSNYKDGREIDQQKLGFF